MSGFRRLGLMCFSNMRQEGTAPADADAETIAATVLQSQYSLFVCDSMLNPYIYIYPYRYCPKDSQLPSSSATPGGSSDALQFAEAEDL